MNARRADGTRADGARTTNGSGRTITDKRKQAVSIRMSRGDVRHIKQLAERLGVRDSDVVRYAIKSMLSKLAPLPDGSVCGRALLPVFVESGSELMRHFDLDASRMAEIINEGADASRRVDAGDVQLIAMTGTQAPYAKVRFAVIGRDQAVERAPHNGGIPSQNGHSHEAGYGSVDASVESARQSLRQYIYEKYLFAQSATAAGGGSNGAG
jgi:hypothetical protein